MPPPVVEFTLAVSGIWSIVPEPSRLITASTPFSKARRDLSISSRLNFTSPRSLPSVACCERFEISHTFTRRTGEPTNEANCDAVPLGQLATVPAVSAANCWIAAPPCVRTGTQNDPRCEVPRSVTFEHCTFLPPFSRRLCSLSKCACKSAISSTNASFSIDCTASSVPGLAINVPSA